MYFFFFLIYAELFQTTISVCNHGNNKQMNDNDKNSFDKPNGYYYLFQWSKATRFFKEPLWNNITNKPSWIYIQIETESSYRMMFQTIL